MIQSAFLACAASLTCDVLTVAWLCCTVGSAFEFATRCSLMNGRADSSFSLQVPTNNLFCRRRAVVARCKYLRHAKRPLLVGLHELVHD